MVLRHKTKNMSAHLRLIKRGKRSKKKSWKKRKIISLKIKRKNRIKGKDIELK